MFRFTKYPPCLLLPAYPDGVPPMRTLGCFSVTAHVGSPVKLTFGACWTSLADGSATRARTGRRSLQACGGRQLRRASHRGVVAWVAKLPMGSGRPGTPAVPAPTALDCNARTASP